MAENDPIPATDNTAPQMRVLTQYTKDLSFENPNAPRTLGQLDTGPQISVRVDVNVQRLAEADFEVVLVIGVDAKAKEDTLFLTELQYAGLFRFENISQENLEPLLLIEALRHLFPFARRVIADATRDGGFPPLMIDPIDFMQLYQQRLQQNANAAPVDGAAGKPN